MRVEKKETCTFQCILLVCLPDHPVFPEGLQESEDFASSEQSADALLKRKGALKEGFVKPFLLFPLDTNHEVLLTGT